MSFLDKIFASLEMAGQTAVLQEIRDGRTLATSGFELLAQVGLARAYLAARGLKKGDRCGLHANNGVRWIAMDLAAMAEGLVVVPLYTRQAPAELVAMMKDCSPLLICCGDTALRDGVAEEWPEAPAQALFEDIFAAQTQISGTQPAKTQVPLNDSDPVTIIYT